jgi:acyl carrier protein
MSDTAQQVVAIVTKWADAGGRTIELNDKLSDIGLKSLSTVDMIFDLEEKFNIQIPFNANDPAAGQFETVGDVVRAIENLTGSKS